METSFLQLLLVLFWCYVVVLLKHFDEIGGAVKTDLIAHFGNGNALIFMHQDTRLFQTLVNDERLGGGVEFFFEIPIQRGLAHIQMVGQ